MLIALGMIIIGNEYTALNGYIFEQFPFIYIYIYIFQKWLYRKISNISRTLQGNKIVDHSDVVGASPAGVAPTTSSFPI